MHVMYECIDEYGCEHVDECIDAFHKWKETNQHQLKVIDHEWEPTRLHFQNDCPSFFTREMWLTQKLTDQYQ